MIASSEETGRLSGAIFIFNPSPFQYNNFYVAISGGILHAIGIFGLNQMALQRYCSMPSLAKANAVMALAVPSHIIVGFMAMYLGIYIIRGDKKKHPASKQNCLSIETIASWIIFLFIPYD